ncbi:MAG: glycosyltransferase family 9 protein [Brevundimonas sp.]|nr:MAG: glycosyltransferase family 9 protein [Brevundimonas sp.]
MAAPQVLYLSPNRIGDSVIASGVVREIGRQRPGARITVLTSGPAAAFYRAAPGVERVIVVDKEKGGRHWPKMWRAARGPRWDLTVDTRGSVVTRLISAKERRIYRRALEHDTPKVEMIARLMKVDGALEPELFIDDQARTEAARVIDAGGATGPVLALAPLAVQPGKSWPPERWAALVETLKADASFDGWRFMVVGGPSDRAAATPALTAAGPRGVDFVGQGDILASSAAIQRASLFAGNDSGLMHVAAAAGTPTLGLFGPTPWWLYGPRGPRTRIVAANTERGAFAPIEDLTVEQVVAGLKALRSEYPEHRA